MSSLNQESEKKFEPKIHSFLNPEENTVIEVEPVDNKVYFSPNTVDSVISNTRPNNQSNFSNDNLNYTEEKAREDLQTNKKTIESDNFQTYPKQDFIRQNQSNQQNQDYQPKPKEKYFEAQTRAKPESSKIKLNFDITKVLSYLGLTIGLSLALFANHWLGLLVFWLLALLAVRTKSTMAWIVVLIVLLYILIIFPVSNYLTLAAAGVAILSAIFLGASPKISKFNKYITGILAIVLGLWVTIPMSQMGSFKYVQTQYQQNSVFQTLINSAYIGVGSPKLSPTEIEKSFKEQISSEISTSIKDKTKLLPADIAKISQLCTQLGVEQNQTQACQNLDKSNLDKSIDSTVSAQVDQQTKDLKDQFFQYPQVQMVQNLLNGLSSSDNSILSSIYFIPGIVLLLIFVFVSAFLQLISWPILILFKKISLS